MIVKLTTLRFFPFLFLVIGLLNSQQTLAVEFDQRIARKWIYEEYSLTYTGNTDNPFDLEASVIFEHVGSSEVRKTDLFYAGGNTWKFRVTPTQTGKYSFKTQSVIPAMNNHTGELVVSENDNRNVRGYLTSINNKWVWESNLQVITPQYLMWGSNDITRSRLAEFADDEIVENMISEFINGHGFNGFHTGDIGRGWFNVNQAGQPLVSNETNPDIATFDALENLITRTYLAGGHIHIWMWGDQQRGFTPINIPASNGGGLNGTIDRRLQRYIAARLGPLPGWSMGYGFDVDEWDARAANGESWKEYIAEKSGWFHFLGSRPKGPNDGLKQSHSNFNSWNSKFNYSSYEHHLGDYSNEEVYEIFSAALETLPAQPAFSEDRARIGFRKKDVTEKQTRDFMWASTMAGGIANIWGQRDDGSLLPSKKYSNKTQLKTYARFFHENNRLLVDMEQANNLSSDYDARVLYSPSKDSYVVYRENTNTIQINLCNSPSSLPAVAVSTESAYSEIDLGMLGNSNHEITLPSKSNWAIAIGNSNLDSLLSR